MHIVVDPQKCTGCGVCVSACPLDAISLEGDLAVIDQAHCDLDGICIPVCPVDALGLAD